MKECATCIFPRYSFLATRALTLVTRYSSLATCYLLLLANPGFLRGKSLLLIWAIDIIK